MPVVEGIDLDEIRIRESERVEWKLRAADPKDVVRSVVAIANDLHNLGGGYIVCGAEEAENAHGFQRLVAQGLTAQEIKRIQDKAVGALRSQVSPPLAVRTVEIPVSDPARRILVIVVAQSPQAHQFEKEYWIRSGRQTQSARNGVLLELNRQKRAGASVDLGRDDRKPLCVTHPAPAPAPAPPPDARHRCRSTTRSSTCTRSTESSQCS